MKPNTRYYAWKTRKYALPFIAIALLFGLAVIFVMSRVPSDQTASARLLFESAELEKQTQNQSAATRQAERLEIIRFDLQRAETLITVADTFDLFAGLERQDRIRQMQSRLKFRTVPRKDSLKIITLSFRHANAELAANIANAFAAIAVEKNREMRQLDTGGSLTFFQADVTAKQALLDAARKTLSSFQTANSNTMPERLNMLLERKARIEERLLALDTPSFRPAVQALKTREIVRLETDLVAAKSRLSDQHPDVLRLEGELDRLNKHWAMADQLKTQPSQAQGLKTELAEIETWIADIPGKAVILEALRYDYEFAEKQHLAAVERLSDARIRRQVEDVEQGQRLTILSHATPPEIRPNQKKLVLTGLGILASMVLAAIAVFLLNLADQKIRRPRDLERRLGITPFATLPKLTPISVSSGP